MSVHLSRASSGVPCCAARTPDLAPKPQTDPLRRRFDLCLQNLLRAIAEERELALALDSSGRGLFDPANRAWLRAAEQAWDQVTDDLIVLRTLAVSCPDTPLAQMAFCIRDALGCDSRPGFDQHTRFGVQILQRAFVGPASREVVQALRTAVSHLEAIAKLDRFAPDEIDPPRAASSPPSI
ncbi:MAG: hypothetical protein JXQ89_20590 [Pelagimonas sp.]